MKQEKFSWKKRLKSFRYAFNGIKILLKEEYNARIHVFAALCVGIVGFVFRISRNEWIAVLFCIGLTIALEMLNSAIENLADFVSPEKQEQIKKVKDLAAGAVLIGAVIALTVGSIVFLPKLMRYF